MYVNAHRSQKSSDTPPRMLSSHGESWHIPKPGRDGPSPHLTIQPASQPAKRDFGIDPCVREFGARIGRRSLRRGQVGAQAPDPALAARHVRYRKAPNAIDFFTSFCCRRSEAASLIQERMRTTSKEEEMTSNRKKTNKTTKTSTLSTTTTMKSRSSLTSTSTIRSKISNGRSRRVANWSGPQTLRTDGPFCTNIVHRGMRVRLAVSVVQAWSLARFGPAARPPPTEPPSKRILVGGPVADPPCEPPHRSGRGDPPRPSGSTGRAFISRTSRTATLLFVPEPFHCAIRERRPHGDGVFAVRGGGTGRPHPGTAWRPAERGVAADGRT